jgi:rare lipoprotein A
MFAMGVALSAGGFVGCSRSAPVALIEPRPVSTIASTPAHRAGNPPRSEAPVKVGLASWYGARFARRKTANGESYDPSQLTAASMTLPLGTKARVTNLENGRSTVVRINDRGPHVKGREIDLSRQAAQKLGFKKSGTAQVEIRVLQRAIGDSVVGLTDTNGSRQFTFRQ